MKKMGFAQISPPEDIVQVEAFVLFGLDFKLPQLLFAAGGTMGAFDAGVT